ncbi:hypothetical protein [Marivirga sp.]|uniref:hypothetical protein n=1 Tax=Marivirga sp. TaxID=2018662 RepID=UPI002D7F6097|nr:hypothetical protein [Marivirga sp.]HET8860439.1 hypothetical protein [Marivirga sp.]
MKFKFSIIFSILVVAIHFEGKAQEDTKLSEQYQNMIESSETFEQYKVISITKINSFGEIMNDSINSLKTKVSAATAAREKAEQESDAAKSQMSDLQNELEEAQIAVDKMPFLGIPMNKTTYNVVMWSIVIVLVAALIIVYFMFLKSFRLTRQAKKDKDLIDQELEDLRQRSQEKQVKIKRELQTALNKLEEYKR